MDKNYFMKPSLLVSTVLVSLLAGCSHKELSREDAFTIIKREMSYPKEMEFKIYAGDPEEAAKLKNSFLEKDGFIEILSSKTLSDPRPWISFTGKSAPYLLPTPEKDIKYAIQRVKTAEENIDKVTGIQMQKEDKEAIVEYSTVLTHITPFGEWLKFDTIKSPKHNVLFSLYDDGWRMEKPQ